MQTSQRPQNTQGRRIVREERQEVKEEYQIPVQSRTHTTYEIKNRERVISPRGVDATRTTNYNLIRDLNRQAAGNPAVKNQIQDQARSRDYAYNYGNDSNVIQSQERSSRDGRIYHYEPTTRRNFPGRYVPNREQRGRNISSVESSQKGNIQYQQFENDNYQNRPNRE